jgi:hypothetical protein
LGSGELFSDVAGRTLLILGSMTMLKRVVEFGGGPPPGEERRMELHPQPQPGDMDPADETVTETEGETSADEGSLF